MNRKTVKKVITHIILIGCALFYIIPFYIVIITAFKSTNAIATATPFIWFPRLDQLSFQGFIDVFTTYTIFATGDSMVATGFKNTLIVVIPVIIVGMFSSSISAYAFAKINFRLKKFMFMILIFSMMLPGIILLIPSYFIYDNLGLTNTFFPLIVPPMFGSAICVFFLRQYYASIPNELI
ncbi:MAG: carbohydrate ABC transporter permease, partial [Bacilli bacterium]